MVSFNNLRKERASSLAVEKEGRNGWVMNEAIELKDRVEKKECLHIEMEKGLFV